MRVPGLGHDVVVHGDRVVRRLLSFDVERGRHAKVVAVAVTGQQPRRGRRVMGGQIRRMEERHHGRIVVHHTQRRKIGQRRTVRSTDLGRCEEGQVGRRHRRRRRRRRRRRAVAGRRAVRAGAGRRMEGRFPAAATAQRTDQRLLGVVCQRLEGRDGRRVAALRRRFADRVDRRSADRPAAAAAATTAATAADQVLHRFGHVASAHIQDRLQ